LRSTPTSRVSVAEAIHLPPPFTLVRLRESGDAFAHACRIAPKSGAGTLVCVGRFDLAEFAVVLEPGEPLGTARRAFYAGMVALTAHAGGTPTSDSLTAALERTLQPEVAVRSRSVATVMPGDGARLAAQSLITTCQQQNLTRMNHDHDDDAD